MYRQTVGANEVTAETCHTVKGGEKRRPSSNSTASILQLATYSEGSVNAAMIVLDVNNEPTTKNNREEGDKERNRALPQVVLHSERRVRRRVRRRRVSRCI